VPISEIYFDKHSQLSITFVYIEEQNRSLEMTTTNYYSELVGFLFKVENMLTSSANYVSIYTC